MLHVLLNQQDMHWILFAREVVYLFCKESGQLPDQFNWAVTVFEGCFMKQLLYSSLNRGREPPPVYINHSTRAISGFAPDLSRFSGPLVLPHSIVVIEWLVCWCHTVFMGFEVCFVGARRIFPPHPPAAPVKLLQAAAAVLSLKQRDPVVSLLPALALCLSLSLWLVNRAVFGKSWVCNVVLQQASMSTRTILVHLPGPALPELHTK